MTARGEGVRGRPIGRAVRTSVYGVLVLGGLLLIPAGLVAGGTWLWGRGLAFVAAYGTSLLIGNLVLAWWRPAHFMVREQAVVAAKGKTQPRSDAIGSVIFLCVVAAWAVFIPLDVFRLHLLPAPTAWVADLGLAASIVGLALTPLAVWENRFAAPHVQDQTEDGQTVIQSGVYGLIRHPIYLGNLLMPAGAALWLGSTAACAATVLFLLATVGRIAIEERDLRARLPDYADYARRVRGRLIPFLI